MSTLTDLQTILSTTQFRVLQRHGTAASLDLAGMHAGEIAVATDTHAVYVCFGDGIVTQINGGIAIKGLYADLAALEAAHETGSTGDFYLVGAAAPFTLYGWFNSDWVSCGAFPS